MNEGDGLLDRCLDNILDHAPRLVYADWLDDHDQPVLAAFLRERAESSLWSLTDKVPVAVRDWCEQLLGTDYSVPENFLLFGLPVVWSWPPPSKAPEKYLLGYRSFMPFDAPATRGTEPYTKTIQYLSSFQLTQENLHEIKRMHQLRAVRFTQQEMLAEFLSAFADHENLRALKCENTNLHIRVLGGLVSCTKLQEVDFSQTKQVKKDWKTLSRLVGLEKVTLQKISMTKDVCQALTHLPRLRTLDIAYNEISKETIEVLAELTNLESLDISHHYNNYGFELEPLGKLFNLRSLRIVNSVFDDSRMESLCDLGELRHLNISASNVKLREVPSLGNLRKLESLDLGGTAIDDESIQSLAVLENLRSLYLGGTLVSKEAIRLLQRKLPECRIDR